MLDGPGGRAAGRFVPLGDQAIPTRRKDATVRVTVALSKPQATWLRQAERDSGGAVDASAVVRALVDLGRELELDWAAVGSVRELRDAVRAAVMVRRGGAGS
jgi:hypothetical protein